ncbi:hypothetical protein ACIBH1_37740 [Nonomuraea sp. NPDC050663]|uniref:hypothetical protein n=1 Tax=Nonomuraea sp. NPDC050663 TaxID=3364370 RepID=UPI003798FC63
MEDELGPIGTENLVGLLVQVWPVGEDESPHVHGTDPTQPLAGSLSDSGYGNPAAMFRAEAGAADLDRSQCELSARREVFRKRWADLDITRLRHSAVGTWSSMSKPTLASQVWRWDGEVRWAETGRLAWLDGQDRPIGHDQDSLGGAAENRYSEWDRLRRPMTMTDASISSEVSSTKSASSWGRAPHRRHHPVPAPGGAGRAPQPRARPHFGMEIQLHLAAAYPANRPRIAFRKGAEEGQVAGDRRSETLGPLTRWGLA